jgi:NADH-quinone oxidoreductase subunit G
LGTLWSVLAAEVPVLASVTYANLPATGLLLDRTAWTALPFVEGETLHYKPAATEAVAKG